MSLPDPKVNYSWAPLTLAFMFGIILGMYDMTSWKVVCTVEYVIRVVLFGIIFFACVWLSKNVINNTE